MLWRKHPTISVLANLLRLAESRSVRESQRDSVPEPRVARHELPWVIVRQTSPTATRLRPSRSRPRAPDLSHNAVGVDSISERAPKVGVARQPWAGGPNPFGIVRSAGLRLLRLLLPTALRMVQGCCGSETRAPEGVSDAPVRDLFQGLLLPARAFQCYTQRLTITDWFDRVFTRGKRYG